MVGAQSPMTDQDQTDGGHIGGCRKRGGPACSGVTLPYWNSSGISGIFFFYFVLIFFFAV